MANQEDGFLREIEEGMRRERLEKIWRQYGAYILIGAAAIVLGVLGYKFWENSRITAAQSTGARYEDAMSLLAEKKEGSAAKEFEAIAADGNGGYKSLARLQLAGALLNEGKKAEALAAYEALGKESGGDEMLKGYAQLQAASIRLGEADFTEMQNRLTPLMGDQSPWRFSARELLGMAAFKAGRAEEARGLLTPLLVDQKTPQSIGDRVQIVMAEIAAGDLAKKSAATEPAKSGTDAASKSDPEFAPPAGAPGSSKKE